MSKIYRSLQLSGVVLIALATFFATSAEVQARTGAHPAPWIGKRIDGKDCKSVQIGAGPWDYLQRNNHLGYLAVTEENHFNEDVEALRAGMTTEPMGDIHYTLSAWPNHHRALKSAVDFRLQHPKWPKHSKGLPAECYLQRAINYSPKDGTPYLLLGILLHKMKKYEPALEAYQNADRLIPNDMMIKYNMALAMVKLKKYKDAKEVAVVVYDNGFPLPGLKNKLRAAGHWGKPADDAEGQASAAKSGMTSNKPEYTEAERAAFIKALQEQKQKLDALPEPSSEEPAASSEQTADNVAAPEKASVPDETATTEKDSTSQAEGEDALSPNGGE